MGKKTQVSWNLNEIRTLRKLTESGMSGVKISRAYLLSRHTAAAVRSKMSELALGNAAIRQRLLNAKRQSKPKRVAILVFLQTQEARCMNSFDAAGKLGINQRMVSYYRRKHGLQLPIRLQYTSQRYIAAHAHVLAALNRGRKESERKFWVNRRELMFRELSKDADQNAIPALLQCKSCKKRWPQTGKYFYYGHILPDGKRRIQPYCRACGKDLWHKHAGKS